ncbi:histidine kinase [Stenotrophomonas sp. YIM B06876]|uniref:sensor histidine kinase n=1 Tax=Stenotrophomonas sp. YIM B06876 TaxID=3060211 RepID=UPI00273889CF|nr:histidine kinase [Stenotrophomonas sp. YIM B06876]
MRRTPPPQSQLDALWQASVIVWILLAGEGLALVLTLAPGVENDRLTYFGLTSLIIQWVSLLTLGSLYLLRRQLVRLRPIYVAYTALLLLIVASSLVSASAWLLLHEFWAMPAGGWHSLFVRFLGISLTVGLLGLAAIQNHLRARQLAIHAQRSRLEALQARIQPHFLFNTLNTGVALIQQRPEQAERLLLDLADLFRAALASPSNITLGEELELAKRYLEIESLRLGQRLVVVWDLPELIAAVTLPSLSIQPLVENAIRHGIEPFPLGGTLQISVSNDNGYTKIAITNPVSPSASLTQGHQIGLESVRARLKAMTREKGRLETYVEDGRYVATILLPPNPQVTTR